MIDLNQLITLIDATPQEYKEVMSLRGEDAIKMKNIMLVGTCPISGEKYYAYNGKKYWVKTLRDYKD